MGLIPVDREALKRRSKEQGYDCLDPECKRQKCVDWRSLRAALAAPPLCDSCCGHGCDHCNDSGFAFVRAALAAPPDAEMVQIRRGVAHSMLAELLYEYRQGRKEGRPMASTRTHLNELERAVGREESA